MTALALRIDAAGFAAGRVDPGDSGEIHRRAVPTAAAWDSCRELLSEVVAGTEVSTVGIACAGPIDMGAGVVAPTEIRDWRTGFAIVDAVGALFPRATVQLALDGVCLALAERTLGATRGVMDSLAISLSDRICGGITVGGFGVVGRTGNAGNLGHVLVPGSEEPCECGGRGCLEAVAGGVSVLRWARARGWSGDSVAALVTAAAAGQEIPVAALGRAGSAVGQAISSLTAALDIDLAVVSGGLVAAGPALWKPLGEAVASHARLGYLAGLRVVPSELGEDAVLIGAGALAWSIEGREAMNSHA